MSRQKKESQTSDFSRRHFLVGSVFYGATIYWIGRKLADWLSNPPQQVPQSPDLSQLLTEKQMQAIKGIEEIEPSQPGVKTEAKRNHRLEVYDLYDLDLNFEAVKKIRAGAPEGLVELYSDYIEAAAKKYHLDPNLHRALIFFESGFHPSIVSSSYATGLGQIMHFHGENLDFTDPQTNLIKSAEILRGYHDGRVRERFEEKGIAPSDEELLSATVKAYNAGPNRPDFPNFPVETEKYANKIFDLYSDNLDKQTLLDYMTKEGHGIWSYLYWIMMPTNPLAGNLKRTGVDFGAQSKYQPQGHSGWDFASQEGEPIYPAVEGRVAFSGWLYGQPKTKTGHGWTVVLQHDTSYLSKLWQMPPIYTVYSHLSEFVQGFEMGKFVSPENPIGYVGSTGASDEPHLHYAVHYGGGVDRNIREMVAGKWKHPLWLLPPKQNYPGEKKLSL